MTIRQLYLLLGIISVSCSTTDKQQSTEDRPTVGLLPIIDRNNSAELQVEIVKAAQSFGVAVNALSDSDATQEDWSLKIHLDIANTSMNTRATASSAWLTWCSAGPWACYQIFDSYTTQLALTAELRHNSLSIKTEIQLPHQNVSSSISNSTNEHITKDFEIDYSNVNIFTSILSALFPAFYYLRNTPTEELILQEALKTQVSELGSWVHSIIDGPWIGFRTKSGYKNSNSADIIVETNKPEVADNAQILVNGKEYGKKPSITRVHDDLFRLTWDVVPLDQGSNTISFPVRNHESIVVGNDISITALREDSYQGINYRPPAAGLSTRRQFALLIGVDKYHVSLYHVVSGLIMLRETLHKLFSFETFCYFNESADVSGIAKALLSLHNAVTKFPDSNVVIVMAGHVRPDGYFEAYRSPFSAVNGDEALFSLGDILIAINNLDKAKHVLLVVDGCFALEALQYSHCRSLCGSPYEMQIEEADSITSRSYLVSTRNIEAVDSYVPEPSSTSTSPFMHALLTELTKPGIINFATLCSKLREEPGLSDVDYGCLDKRYGDRDKLGQIVVLRKAE